MPKLKEKDGNKDVSKKCNSNNTQKRQDKLTTLTNGTSKLVRRLGGYSKKQPNKNLTNGDINKKITKPTTLDVAALNLEIGREVAFEYNSAFVSGVIRYIGATDFSPGKWCGIELNEGIGKHNGTVNGKFYFACRDSYGVFIRFSKVADRLSPTGGTPTSIQPDMKISIESGGNSVKASKGEGEVQNGDIRCKPEDAKKSNVDLSAKNKKSRKLPAKGLFHNGIRKDRDKARKESIGKNVPVSSFTTPTPLQSVVVTPNDGYTVVKISRVGAVVDSGKDDNFLPDNVGTFPSDNIDSIPPNNIGNIPPDNIDNIPPDNNVTIPPDNIGNIPPDNIDNISPDNIGNIPPDNIDNIPPDNISSEGTPSYVSNEISLGFPRAHAHAHAYQTDSSNPMTPDTEEESDTVFSETDSRKDDIGIDTCERSLSKIPRRVRSLTKSSQSVTTPTENSGKFTRNNSESDVGKIKNDKSVVPSSDSLLRSSKRNMVFNRNAPKNRSLILTKPPTTEIDKNRPSSRENIIPFRGSRTPSLQRKPIMTALPRNAVTPMLGRKNSEPAVTTKPLLASSKSLLIKVSKKQRGNEQVWKIAESSTVSDTTPCVKKPPESDKDVKASEKTATTIESSVCQQTDENKVNKKTKDRKTKIISKTNTKVPKLDAKGLKKEVENLQNQLKERTDRINELETNLNTNNELKHEVERKLSVLETQLNVEKRNSAEIEEKLTNAQVLVNKSSNAFDALGVVLQYYLKQIENVTKRLSETVEEEAKLRVKNGELSSETESVKCDLQELMVKLDAEKQRCVTLQGELEELATTHQAEVKVLTERHELDKSNLETSLKEKLEMRTLEAEKEHRLKIEDSRQNHRNELVSLSNAHQHHIQTTLEENEQSINTLVTSHGLVLEAKEGAHAQDIRDLEMTHARKYNELMERLNDTIIEKEKIGNRLDVVVKELESDSKVQAALHPYKHLPDELKSLNVVLELKNEEIKTHRVKNMEQQKKVDEYYELQTRFESISQENQYLKESLKKRALSERRLSVERDNLLEKFENELKKVDMLAMEKEQLMWRACHTADLSASLPNVFEDVEDEGCSMSPLRSSGSFSTSPPIAFAPGRLKKGVNTTLPYSKSNYGF